jgi:hypothetical protein
VCHVNATVTTIRKKSRDMGRPEEQRQAAVEHALRAASLKLLAREISIHEALAAVGAAMNGEDARATPRELAAAGREAYRREVLAQMEGRGRDAAWIVARMHARDPRDPIELESLTNKFRRWRRAEKRARARLPPSV